MKRLTKIAATTLILPLAGCMDDYTPHDVQKPATGVDSPAIPDRAPATPNPTAPPPNSPAERERGAGIDVDVHRNGVDVDVDTDRNRNDAAPSTPRP